MIFYVKKYFLCKEISINLSHLHTVSTSLGTWWASISAAPPFQHHWCCHDSCQVYLMSPILLGHYLQCRVESNSRHPPHWIASFHFWFVEVHFTWFGIKKLIFLSLLIILLIIPRAFDTVIEFLEITIVLNVNWNYLWVGHFIDLWVLIYLGSRHFQTLYWLRINLDSNFIFHF